MNRRPPPKKGKAQVQSHVTVEKGKGNVVLQEDQVELADTDIEPGEAKISVGYDSKRWGSDQVGGMTVGCSTFVTLSCRQHAGVLKVANDVAAELAWSFLKRNEQRTKERLMAFADGKNV